MNKYLLGLIVLIGVMGTAIYFVKDKELFAPKMTEMQLCQKAATKFLEIDAPPKIEDIIPICECTKNELKNVMPKKYKEWEQGGINSPVAKLAVCGKDYIYTQLKKKINQADKTWYNKKFSSEQIKKYEACYIKGMYDEMYKSVLNNSELNKNSFIEMHQSCWNILERNVY